MKELFDYILRFGNLNQKQIDFITSKAVWYTILFKNSTSEKSFIVSLFN
ncbi:hypothetical protein [Chryseobacterium sp. Hurlbut01]|nr:hypothetical protein [Chryseobacterium sp. Hurlbut01]